MIARKIRTETYFWSLLLVVVTLPFTKHYNSLAIGLMVFASLFTNSWKEKVKHVKDQPWVWLFVAYWLIHATALIYTENIKSGMFVLEKKSGMWVLPLILVSAVPLAKEKLHRLLMAFVIACTAGLTVCLVKGLYWWWFRQSDEYLFYHGLSNTIGIHAVYFSVYLAVSVLILLLAILPNRNFSTVLVYCWMGYLLVGIFMLASKTIILTLLVPGSIFLLIYVLRKRQYKRFGIYMGVVLFTIFLLFVIPKTRERFQQLFETEFHVLELSSYRYDTPFSGLSLRMVIWKYTFHILNDHHAWIIGVGPGDSQDLLDSKYKEVGIYTGNSNIGDHGYLGYNAHNQYLQALLDTGIIGLALLLALLVLLLREALKRNDLLLLSFVVLFMFFLLSESALEAHHGSVFFTLFAVLLLINGRNNREIAKSSAD